MSLCVIEFLPSRRDWMGPEAELRTQPGHLDNFENLTAKIIFMLTMMMMMMAMTVASQLAMSSAR